MVRRFLTLRWLLLLAASGMQSAVAETLAQNLYPAGGGHFAVSLSPCNGKEAVLTGSLTNNTDAVWLYIEIQVKVTQGHSTTLYRLNLERIGPKGGTIRQRIDGPGNPQCTSVRLSDLELVSAYSEARAGGTKR